MMEDFKTILEKADADISGHDDFDQVTDQQMIDFVKHYLGKHLGLASKPLNEMVRPKNPSGWAGLKWKVTERSAVFFSHCLPIRTVRIRCCDGKNSGATLRFEEGYFNELFEPLE